MMYMQLFQKKKYKYLSDKNRINIITIPALRGQIYDVKNNILAKNEVAFKLLIDKTITTHIEEFKKISQTLSFTTEEYDFLYDKIKKAPSKSKVTIVSSMQWKQIAAVEEVVDSFKSITISSYYRRIYNVGPQIAHLLGYINQNRSEAISGIEKYYDSNLKGIDGYRKVEVNALGKEVRILEKENSINGNNVYLNIDSNLQDKIMGIIKDKSCAVSIINCANGSLLTLASSPTFDPNMFYQLPKNYWNEIINNPYKPLINKNIHNTYPIGSIFKIITALAGLEFGIDPKEKFLCSNHSFFDGYNGFRCTSKIGHGIGMINMSNSIKYSCNHYIYKIASIIGANRIIDMATKFGLGKTTGIDLLGEASGFVPSIEWKKEKLGINWTLGDTLNLSIGQGYLLATPIQISRMMAAIASEGILYTPRIAIDSTKIENLNIKNEYIKIIKNSLYSVVNEAGGTGKLARIDNKNILISGKTATAQVRSKSFLNEDFDKKTTLYNNRNHAIFAGYISSNKGQYAISVYNEHAGSAAKEAAPLVHDIAIELKKDYL